jgi:D-alanyl-D-alanine dipeptidase
VRALIVVWLIVIALAGFAHASTTPMRATGYVNGRAIALRLVEIDGVLVEVATARAFVRMRDAAARAGIELMIRSAFRDHETQTWLYQAWRAGWGNKAARPGYSNHQAGRALDLVIHDPQTLAWLTRHAGRYGFRRTVRSEPWHWERRR